MGSFLGHALPGLFFIALGLWWMVQISRTYFRSLLQQDGGNSPPFRNSLIFPVRLCNRSVVKVELYMGLLFCLAGVSAELVFSPVKNGHLGIGNVQHATMYSGYILPILPELLLHKCDVISVTMINQLTYSLYIIANLIEALLFQFHLYGKPSTDVLIHTLLVYTITGIVIMTLLEMKHRENVLFGLARIWLTLIQGTWFWQASFVLYPLGSDPWGDAHDNATLPHEDPQTIENQHHQNMTIACSYAWHMIVHLLWMSVLLVCVGKCLGRSTEVNLMRMKDSILSSDDCPLAVEPNQNGYVTIPQVTDNEAEGIVDNEEL